MYEDETEEERILRESQGSIPEAGIQDINDIIPQVDVPSQSVLERFKAAKLAQDAIPEGVDAGIEAPVKSEIVINGQNPPQKSAEELQDLIDFHKKSAA